MSGETNVSEKVEAHSCHSAESPTSPTATNVSGPTVTGDAVITIRDSASDDGRSETTVATSASASADDSDSNGNSPQPRGPFSNLMTLTLGSIDRVRYGREEVALAQVAKEKAKPPRC